MLGDTHTMTLTPSTFCMTVIAQTRDAVYLRLPAELQREIEGGCECVQCKASIDLPRWDTLVVPTDASERHADYSYTVHMPAGCVESFKKHVGARGMLIR